MKEERRDGEHPELKPLSWREYRARPDREHLPFWRYFADEKCLGTEDGEVPARLPSPTRR